MPVEVGRPTGRHEGATGTLDLAILVQRLDPGIAGLRARALVPALALRQAGGRASIIEHAPAGERLSGHDALLVVAPRGSEMLACAGRAAELGLAVVVDFDAALLREAESRDRRGTEARRLVTALAQIATLAIVASQDDVARLARISPVAAPVQVVPAFTESAADRALLLRSFRREFLLARLWRLLARARAGLLSRRGLPGIPLRLVNKARSHPIRKWPLGVRAVVRRRLAALRPILAGPEAASAAQGSAQASSAPVSASPPAPVEWTPGPLPAADLPAVQALWLPIIADAVARSPRRTGQVRAAVLRVVAFMDLLQDLDVLLPLLERLRADARFSVSVVVTDWLDRVSPRVSRELLKRGLVPTLVTKKDVQTGLAPDLANVGALVTACESSHPAHRVPFALVRRANGAGIPTYTLQHGLENIGLTYFAPDPEHEGPIEFASSSILTWGPVDQLPGEVTGTVRARCVGVGSPKPAEAQRVELPLPPGTGAVVAVFENLHWQRYSEAYRAAFLSDFYAAAAARPELTFLLKPHHAGQYLIRNRDLLAAAPGNVVVADPSDPVWEPYTAGSIIGSVDGVVTTPSTVALDAARAGCPVAVAGYDLDLPVYRPLPVLTGLADWSRFLDPIGQATDEVADELARFTRRHVVPGDSVGRILDLMAADGEDARRRAAGRSS